MQNVVLQKILELAQVAIKSMEEDPNAQVEEKEAVTEEVEEEAEEEEEEEETPEPEPKKEWTPFDVVKNEDGKMMWIARFTNSFIDSDGHPQVVTAASQKRFENMVKSGEVPPPDAMLWHEPLWTFGTGLGVVTDEIEIGKVVKDYGGNPGDTVVFSIAYGEVIPGRENIAEAIAKNADNLRVSHRMPGYSLAFEDENRTFIKEHVSTEVSFLPKGREAHPLTGGTVVIKRGQKMDEKKRAELKAALGVTDEALNELEQQNVGDVLTAVAEGRIYKQKSEAEEAETPAEGDAPDTAKAEGNEEAQYVTRDELVETIKEINDALKALSENVANQIGGLKQAVDKQAEEEERNWRPAITKTFDSIVGKAAAQVKEGEEIAKKKPEEREGTQPVFGSSFLAQVMNNGRSQ